MKKYKVKIKGVTPYMQHRMDDTKLELWEKKRGRIIERKDVDQEDLKRAEFHAYKNNGNYFIPSEHLRSAFINAGGYIKAKVGNSRKSMKNIVAAMFYVNPFEISLKGSFEIDKRSCVNKNIKGRVVVIRPRWDKWDAEFELSIDNDTITKETIKEILNYAGQYCGIGSFRPTNNGMYGRFIVEKFNEVKE